MHWLGWLIDIQVMMSWLEMWDWPFGREGWRPRFQGQGEVFSAEGVSSLWGSEGSREQDWKRPRRDVTWGWGGAGRRGREQVWMYNVRAVASRRRNHCREAAEDRTEKSKQILEMWKRASHDLALWGGDRTGVITDTLCGYLMVTPGLLSLWDSSPNMEPPIWASWLLSSSLLFSHGWTSPHCLSQLQHVCYLPLSERPDS